MELASEREGREEEGGRAGRTWAAMPSPADSLLSFPCRAHCQLDLQREEGRREREGSMKKYEVLDEHGFLWRQWK